MSLIDKATPEEWDAAAKSVGWGAGRPLQDNDPVNHPQHYTDHPSGVECIEITEHMGFCLGNAVKYIWRADLKHNAIEDIKKAIWYLEREVAKRQGAVTKQALAIVKDTNSAGQPWSVEKLFGAMQEEGKKLIKQAKGKKTWLTIELRMKELSKLSL